MSGADITKNKPDAPAEISFKDFADNYVREHTKFKNAEELLKSKPSAKYVWLFTLIPAAFILILSAVSGVNNPMGMIIGVVFFAGLGYLASFLLTASKKAKICKQYHGKANGAIYKDELLEFLNLEMNIFSPYFHEWSTLVFETNSALGNMGAENDRKLGVFTVGTEFGNCRSVFVMIDARPENYQASSADWEYFVRVGPKIFGSPSLKAYKIAAKAAPILGAAMEYYTKIYTSSK